MTTPSLEELAVSAAKWVGWQQFQSAGDWWTGYRYILACEVLNMLDGGALLLAAIKGKLEGNGVLIDSRCNCNLPTPLHWSVEIGERDRQYGATELAAMLLALHAAGLIGGEG